MDFRKLFQVLSYLQYPLLVVAFYFLIKPFFGGFEVLKDDMGIIISSFGNVLLFLGLAISFSSLQDNTKTHYKLAEKIWQNPKKARFVIFIGLYNVTVFMGLGLAGYLFADDDKWRDLAFGSIVLGIGCLGFLKVALEVRENHRLDKNPIPTKNQE